MVLARERAIGLFDLVAGRVARDAEDFVVILGGHQCFELRDLISTSERRSLRLSAVPKPARASRPYGMRRGPRIESMPSACGPKRYGTVTTERSASSSLPSSCPIFTLGASAAHRIGDDFVERLLLFDDAQDRTQLAQVLKLGLVEQILRAGRRDGRLFARARRLQRGQHGTAQVLVRADVLRDRRATSASTTSRSGRFAKRALSAFEKRVRSSACISSDKFEQALRGDAERRHDDRDAGARRKPDQLNVLEGLRLLLRLGDEGEVVREPAEQARRAVDDSSSSRLASRSSSRMRRRSSVAEFLGLHQLVHVGPVAGIRGIGPADVCG